MRAPERLATPARQDPTRGSHATRRAATTPARQDPTRGPRATRRAPPTRQDLLTHLVRFAAALRRGGVPVALGDEVDAAASLGHLDIADREDVRLGLRSALRVRPRAWPLYDRLFARHWRPGGDPDSRRRPTRPRNPPAPRPWPARPSPWDRLRPPPGPLRPGDDAPDPASDPDGGRPGYSPRALLRRKSFEACTEEELREMERILARAVRRFATRRSRRLVPSARGRVVDLRRSLRGALAREGELIDLARRERPVELPRLVVLCDTSGSMDPYSRFLLAFVLSLGRVARRTETFSFNTSLTRLTPWIASGNVAATLARFARRVEDWSGGTRIGACLDEFVAGHLRWTVSGDTSVIIMSDGLDRGDTRTLDAAMLAIRRRARRVIWLNPLMGDPRYRPEARGMKAALPHVDRLLPAHNVESLEALLHTLGAQPT